MAKFMIIMDGMEGSDLPLPILPSERLRSTGKIQTVPHGKEADSMGCILRLLGVSEADIPNGRATIEALGQGLSVHPQDFWLRCTMCSVEDQTIIAPANQWDMDRLRQIPMPDGWQWYPIGEYRLLLQIAHAKDRVIHTYPPHQAWGKKIQQVLPIPDTELGRQLSIWSEDTLQALKTSIAIPWGQSGAISIPKLSCKTLCIAHAAVMKGIAKSMGMDCPNIAGATGDVDTDLRAKYQMAYQMKDRYDLICIHVNGCDEAGHRRNKAEKMHFRNQILQTIFMPLYGAGESILLVSDHRTSSKTGKHEAEPVHYWLYQTKSPLQQETVIQPADRPFRQLMEETSWQKPLWCKEQHPMQEKAY